MRTIRFFCQEINPNSILSDSQFHHLTKVLRLQNGSCIELFDGKGTVAKAIISKLEKHSAKLAILEIKTFPKPKNGRIIIAVSIAKGERFDLLTAKCTELGVDRIVPILFERTVKQTIQPHRLETIATESAKQCHRLFLPTIDEPMNLPQAIDTLRAEYPIAQFIFGSLSDGTKSIDAFNPGKDDCVAFVGPEGGLTSTEETTLKQINAQPVSLTDTVLRIETAAITIAAILTTKRTAAKRS